MVVDAVESGRYIYIDLLMILLETERVGKLILFFSSVRRQNKVMAFRCAGSALKRETLYRLGVRL